MTIDMLKLNLAEPRDQAGDARQNKNEREKWLAELEKKSFQINDDQLRHVDSLPSPGRAHVNPPNTDNPSRWPDAAASTAPTPENAARTDSNLLVDQASVPIAPVPARLPVTPRLAAQPSAAWVHPFVTPPLSGTRLTVEAAQAVHRIEVLMSQLRFMDLNVRITRQGEEVTLWIRDFKQKYGQQVYHWIKELQAMLPRSGQKLTRIVVNGKELVHPGELIGGVKWQ